LHNRSQINRDNLNNVRHETSRAFRKKKREYLEDKINKFATNSKLKNIRDLHKCINGCKRGYKPGSNVTKDENSGVLADPHNILNSWKNYFHQALTVHHINEVRQTEMHAPDLQYLELVLLRLKLLLES
jgi:hypothetical protein